MIDKPDGIDADIWDSAVTITSNDIVVDTYAWSDVADDREVAELTCLIATALQAERDKHSWCYDMEKAPKDGKTFLMGWPDYVTETAMWDIGTKQFVRGVWQRGTTMADEHTPDPFDTVGAAWMHLPTPPEGGTGK